MAKTKRAKSDQEETCMDCGVKIPKGMTFRSVSNDDGTVVLGALCYKGCSVKIPDEVFSVIASEAQRLDVKGKEDELKKKLKRNLEIEQGKKKILDVWDECKGLIPEWMHEYLRNIDDQDELKRIGQGYGNVSRFDFLIPGLAKVRFEVKSNRWSCANAIWDPYSSYSPKEPHLSFTNASYWRSSLETTLLFAARSHEEHIANLARWKSKIEKNVQDIKDREARDIQRAARDAEQEQAERDDTQLLLANLRKDPVAVNLLKAYLSLSQERRIFQEEIEGYDNALYSAEEAYSRRASELRRMADDADRRANDERDRAENLQYDLEDAERKAKQCSRGW